MFEKIKKKITKIRLIFFKMIYDLIIIGYGISGLSCAKVAKANKLNFLVLEKSDQLGGCWNNAFRKY